MLDLDDIFISTKFNITTNQIIQLKDMIFEWIANGVTGAVIIGRPRIGKTTAMIEISAKLKEKYGKDLPIFTYNVTNHIPRDKAFYSDLLKMVGHPLSERGTVTALKERLINTLAASACASRCRRIVLFIDEAYHLADKELQWLMDIYNHLYIRDIHLTVFLIGTEELKVKKQALIMSRQHQITGRFMTEEYSFHGIQSVKDLTICLSNFDMNYRLSENNQIIFTKEFFPEAYADGHRLSKASQLIMEVFEQNMKEIGIPESSEIPMQYFMNTVKYCFKKYGIHGKGIYFPDKAAWDDALKHSGYLAAERMYYDV